MRAIRAITRAFRVADPEEQERPYRCQQCETNFGLQYHVCPECGAFSVEREW